MKKIKVLFKIGYAYHKAAFDPVIDLILNDEKYDVWFTLDMEKIRRLFLFDFPFQQPVIDKWTDAGYRFTRETKGFDIVITGDTLRNAPDYGRTLLCFLNHGTGIKNILYRELAKVSDDKYMIFVEGQHRVDSLNNSGRLGKNEVHLTGLHRHTSRPLYIKSKMIFLNKPVNII
jgi:hypothetical protein